MKITASNLTRWAGLSAIAGGALFVGIQAIHPPDVLPSVATGTWVIVHYLGVAMCLFTLLGMVGVYARQAEEAGWLGLAGFLLVVLFWTLTLGFQFVEAVISPLLAAEAPELLEAFLGIVKGTPSEMNLGALPTLWSVTGLLYILSGVLFGIATFRAGVLPRWAGGLLAVAAVAPLASPLLGHPLDRILAVPMGLALAWLGYSLWSERRKQGAQPVPSAAGPRLRQVGAE